MYVNASRNIIALKYMIMHVLKPIICWNILLLLVLLADYISEVIPNIDRIYVIDREY